jgi:hypothetical protein
MRRILSTALAAVVLSATVEAQPAPKAVLSLPDQFERKHDIAQFRGDVLVILYGDKDGMPANKGLGQRLQLHYHPGAKDLPPTQAHRAPVSPLPGLKEGQRSPDVKVLAVVCFGKTPEAIKNIIRNRVRKESPESPVLLDFEGKTSAQFGLKEGKPNLAVIDATGQVRLTSAGELDAAAYTKLTETIDSLRKEAVGSK